MLGRPHRQMTVSTASRSGSYGAEYRGAGLGPGMPGAPARPPSWRRPGYRRPPRTLHTARCHRPTTRRPHQAGPVRRPNPRQQPSALAAHAGICAGPPARAVPTGTARSLLNRRVDVAPQRLSRAYLDDRRLRFPVPRIARHSMRSEAAREGLLVQKQLKSAAPGPHEYVSGIVDLAARPHLPNRPLTAAQEKVKECASA